MELKDKIAVITGGGNGIGAALARAFHAQGAKKIVVADIDMAGAKQVADEIGGLAVACDVSVEAEIQALVERTENEAGPIDLFCSNAGIAISDAPDMGATSASNEAWEKCWKVNTMAHVFAARACLPFMIKRGEGYFLHTVSAAGLLSQIGSATYSATKHAAIGFGEALAIAHGDDGIKVSLLCPQGVDTNMIAGTDQSAPQNRDGIISPEQLAEATIAGLKDESFLILPHPQVRDYMQAKVSNYDRWIGGMRKLRRSITGKVL